MRQVPKSPARQLQSIASRYRLPKFFLLECRSSNIGVLDIDLLGRNAVAESGARWSSEAQAESFEQRLSRLEAILFLAREPLSARRLSQYANLADGTEARTLIRHLNDRYDQQSRAFRVEEIASGFQLLTRPQFASWLRRLGHVPSEIRLSAPALETLAVVAYRQPVLRVDIEAVRGVNCGEILRQLMDRDLIRICGRSEELGRPYLYGTTKRFLQTFGLVDLDQLPRADSLRTPQIRAPGKRLSVSEAAANNQKSITNQKLDAET
jgi:segregation and condensation protein B